ncbi:hypothetical protein ANO11243_086390 [Dothideomycetidae sp. 11243]|nr:hypothetical protein ANO11243_086390 [fungal sp. No.11243]
MPAMLRARGVEWARPMARRNFSFLSVRRWRGHGEAMRIPERAQAAAAATTTTTLVQDRSCFGLAQTPAERPQAAPAPPAPLPRCSVRYIEARAERRSLAPGPRTGAGGGLIFHESWRPGCHTSARVSSVA